MAQPKPSLVEELEDIVPELDRIIADMRCGRPSQTRHDGHVDLVEKLALRMRTAARGPGRPVNPPIGKIGESLVW